MADRGARRAGTVLKVISETFGSPVMARIGFVVLILGLYGRSSQSRIEEDIQAVQSH